MISSKKGIPAARREMGPFRSKGDVVRTTELWISTDLYIELARPW